MAVVTGEVIDLTVPESQRRRVPPLREREPNARGGHEGQRRSRQNNVGQRDDERGQQRMYLYKYITGVRYSPAGELQAHVQWEPTFEPLTSLPLELAKSYLPILRVRQALPDGDEPYYRIRGILGIDFTNSNELRVLVDWEGTWEPLSNLKPEHAQQLEHEMRRFRHHIREEIKYPLFRRIVNDN